MKRSSEQHRIRHPKRSDTAVHLKAEPFDELAAEGPLLRIFTSSSKETLP